MDPGANNKEFLVSFGSKKNYLWFGYLKEAYTREIGESSQAVLGIFQILEIISHSVN